MMAVYEYYPTPDMHTTGKAVRVQHFMELEYASSKHFLLTSSPL